MIRFGWVKPVYVVAVGHLMEIPSSPLVIIIGGCEELDQSTVRV